MNIISVGTIVVLVGIVVYTWLTRDKEDSAEEFANMDRSATWLLIAGTYAATLVSAVGMVGLPGQSYSTGWLYGLANWGSTIGLLLSALFFGPRIRMFGKTTMSEFFQYRFASPNFRFVTSVIIILGTGAYFVSQTIGAGTILETVLGIPFNYTVILILAIVIFLAMVGGAKTVTITDTIMFVIIALTLGIVFCPMVVHKAGFENIAYYATQDPDFFKIGGNVHAPFGTILGFIVLWALGIGAAPTNLTRAFLAKSNRHWLKGMLVAFTVISILIWSAHSAGGALRVINPDIANGNSALPWAALNVVPTVVGLCGVLGLTAACISTADTQILVIAQSFALDIIGHYKRDMTAREGQKYTRIMLIVFGLIGVVLSLLQPTAVVSFGNFGSSVFAAAFFPILTCALFMKHVSKTAAYASMITGIACDFVLHVIPVFMGLGWGAVSYLPYGIHPVIWSTAASFLVLFLFMAIAKPAPAELAAYEEAEKNEEPIDPTISDGNLIAIAVGMMAVGAAIFAYTIYLGMLTG